MIERLEDAFESFREAEEKTLTRLREEVATLRTGRVTVSLVEAVYVEHYGTRTPLNGLASISSADARTLVISPWDPGAIDAIRKALTEAELGAHPVDDGKVVRLVFPSLTDENRQRSLKIMREYIEAARVRLRQARDEALRMIKQAKERAKLTEDDFYEGKSQLDMMIDKANKEIAAIAEKKEKEIVTV